MLKNFQDLCNLLQTPPADWPGTPEDRQWLVGSTNQFIEERGLEWVKANLPMLRESWKVTLRLL